MSQWLVYSRPDCSLCEQMLLDLADLLGSKANDVQVLDISGDPTLERKYGTRIPVLTIDGEFVCDYRLDRDRVREWMK
jgi:hypothetical protein